MVHHRGGAGRLPFGYFAGLLAAFLLAGGPDIGQGPLLTVPLDLLAAIVFASVPLLAARTRFTIMIAGAIVSVVLGLVVLQAIP